MEPKERADAQKAWTTDRVRVIVATIAFGMGINKPDVRYGIFYTKFCITFIIIFSDLCCTIRCPNPSKDITKRVGVQEEMVKLHIVFYIIRILYQYSYSRGFSDIK